MDAQTTGPISAANMPKFTILWGHLEEILLLNKFFRIVDMCLSCEDIHSYTQTIITNFVARISRYDYGVYCNTNVYKGTRMWFVSSEHLKVFTGSIARSANLPVFSLLRGRF